MSEMARQARKFFVTVKDTYCGVRGEYEEVCDTDDKAEADHWFKQWKSEYSEANGYEGFKVSVKVKKD